MIHVQQPMRRERCAVLYSNCWTTVEIVFHQKKSLCGPSRRFFWGLLVSPIFQISKNKLTLLNWTQLPTLFFSDFFTGFFRFFPVFFGFFWRMERRPPITFISTLTVPFKKKGSELRQLLPLHHLEVDRTFRLYRDLVVRAPSLNPVCCCCTSKGLHRTDQHHLHVCREKAKPVSFPSRFVPLVLGIRTVRKCAWPHIDGEPC